MLGFSISEIVLIAVVGIIVIGPKDLPVVIRHAVKFLRELRGLYDGVKVHFDDLVKESGIDDIKRDMTTIIDLEGKPQQAFDVTELEGLRGNATSATHAVAPPPPGGRSGGGLNEATPVPDTAPPQPSPYRGGSAPAAPLVPKADA